MEFNQLLIHQMAISWNRSILRYARFQLYFSAPFSKEKEPLKSNEETEKDHEVANEDTPMIQSLGWASGTDHMLDSFLPLLLSVFLNALFFHSSLVNHQVAWHMTINFFLNLQIVFGKQYSSLSFFNYYKYKSEYSYFICFYLLNY